MWCNRSLLVGACYINLEGNSGVVTRKISDAYYGDYDYIYIRNRNNSLIMSRAIDGLAFCIIIFHQLDTAP